MAEYRVLLPLDGSRLAETSLGYLAALRQLGELRVQLLGVVDDFAEHVQPGFDAEREMNILSSYLREVAGQLRGQLAIDVQEKTIETQPYKGILEVAEQWQPDLLLITTHGRSGATRWRLGSVADKVIRMAECPVFAIGPHVLARTDWVEDESSGPFRRILVPLDGSELAEEALPTALQFATAFGSELHLLRAVPLPPLMNQPHTKGDVIDSLVSQAEGYLSAIVARPGFADARTKIAFGVASDVLYAYVADQGIDMVVMTSHGRGGFVRSALGSVTDRMIGGPAPVLIVRPHE